MVKKKAKKHGLEYVILNDDESELWEIDYDAGHAANVSEYVQLDSQTFLAWNLSYNKRYWIVP